MASQLLKGLQWLQINSGAIFMEKGEVTMSVSITFLSLLLNV